MSDVSYRALAHVTVALRKHALDPGALLAGTCLTVGDLGRRRGYFPWRDFGVVLSRLEEALGHDVMARVGAYGLEAARDLGPRLDVLGSVIDPGKVYAGVHRVIGPVLYPVLRSRLERVSSAELVQLLELPPEHEGCEAYFRACIGAFEALPTALGFEESRVDADVSPYHGHYRIRLPSRPSLRVMVKRSLRSLLRLGDVVEELQTQTAEMQTWHRELSAARERAEEASRHKSSFVATMSHEIRTPVSAIVGVTELLLGDDLPAEQRERVETVHTAARYLANVVNGVLDLAKVERGNVELQLVPVELAALVDDVCRLFGPLSAAKGLTLTSAIGEGVPPVVLLDGVRVSQVLVNLVGNAVKFTDRGSVRLVVEPAGAGALRFVVTDTGPGVPEEDGPRVFQPFVRGAAPSLDGSGLGLSIARGLAAALGARLELDRAPEGGARFALVVEAPVAGGPPRAPPRERYPALRILLVEDDPISRKVGALLLERLGADVDVAVDGNDALERLSAARYELVLMDCHMPNLDGWEATRRLRASDFPSRAALVVALTACGTVKDRDASFAAGMDGFLDKPIDIGALRGWLDKALAARSTD